MKKLSIIELQKLFAATNSVSPFSDAQNKIYYRPLEEQFKHSNTSSAEFNKFLQNKEIEPQDRLEFAIFALISNDAELLQFASSQQDIKIKSQACRAFHQIMQQETFSKDIVDIITNDILGMEEVEDRIFHLHEFCKFPEARSKFSNNTRLKISDRVYEWLDKKDEFEADNTKNAIDNLSLFVNSSDKTKYLRIARLHNIVQKKIDNMVDKSHPRRSQININLSHQAYLQTLSKLLSMDGYFGKEEKLFQNNQNAESAILSNFMKSIIGDDSAKTDKEKADFRDKVIEFQKGNIAKVSNEVQTLDAFKNISRKPELLFIDPFISDETTRDSKKLFNKFFQQPLSFQHIANKQGNQARN